MWPRAGSDRIDWKNSEVIRIKENEHPGHR